MSGSRFITASKSAGPIFFPRNIVKETPALAQLFRFFLRCHVAPVMLHADQASRPEPLIMDVIDDHPLPAIDCHPHSGGQPGHPEDEFSLYRKVPHLKYCMQVQDQREQAVRQNVNSGLEI